MGKKAEGTPARTAGASGMTQGDWDSKVPNKNIYSALSNIHMHVGTCPQEYTST